MRKKTLTQRQKIAAYQQKLDQSTDPDTLAHLVSQCPDPHRLLGVSPSTLSRWLSGQSRAPFAAVQLLRLLSGELPRHFGPWSGWRLSADGDLFPPGWGEGLRREDVLSLWGWRRRAFMADALEIENQELKKALAFYRQEHDRRRGLGFAAALVDVLYEAP